MSTRSTCTALRIGSKTRLRKRRIDDPADELAGEEVVDAEDRRLGQLDAEDLVEVLCRRQVDAEGLLDRHRVGATQGRRRERR